MEQFTLFKTLSKADKIPEILQLQPISAAKYKSSAPYKTQLSLFFCAQVLYKCTFTEQVIYALTYEMCVYMLYPDETWNPLSQVTIPKVSFRHQRQKAYSARDNFISCLKPKIT